MAGLSRSLLQRAFGPGGTLAAAGAQSSLQSSRDDGALGALLGPPQPSRGRFPPIPEGGDALAAPGGVAAARDDQLLASILDPLPQAPPLAPARRAARPVPVPLDLTRSDDAILRSMLDSTAKPPPARPAPAPLLPPGVPAPAPLPAWEQLRRDADDTTLSAVMRGGTPATGAAAAALVAAGRKRAARTAGIGGEDDATLEAMLEEAGARTTSPLTGPVLAILEDVRAARAFHVEVFAGGLGRGPRPDQLYRPMGLAVDGEGCVIVADNGNSRVMRWPAGASQGQLLLAGDDLPPHLGFDPIGVAVDSGRVLMTAGKSLWSTGGGEARPLLEHEAFPEPPCCSAQEPFYTGVALDGHGQVLICDTFDRTVKLGRWDSTGASFHSVLPGELSDFFVTTRRVRGHLHRPFGVAVDGSDGSWLVVDSGNHRVVRWGAGAPHGEIVAGGRGRGGRRDQLNYPRALVVEGPGCYLIADTYNNRVVRWVRGEPRGELVLGGRGAGCRMDQLNRPMGLALDLAGGLLVADTGNHRVLRCLLHPPLGELAAK